MATYKVPCIHCGNMLERSAHVCSKCASRSPFGYHCPTCLNPIKKEDSVCSSCGRKLMTDCPYCLNSTFVGAEKCEYCELPLLIHCENKLCGEPQFFENKKCTVCGKPIKKAAKQIEKINKGEI